MARPAAFKKSIQSNCSIAIARTLFLQRAVPAKAWTETLLTAAELIVRTGGSQDEADELLNRVRARAFNTTADRLSSELKRTATLDNLLEENRLEFACEGHRFWDLVRFGKDVEVLGSRGYTASKRYLPIPQSEIDRAENTLTQNPY